MGLKQIDPVLLVRLFPIFAVLLGLFVYFLAFFLPALYDTVATQAGFDLFLVGPFGIFLGQFAWLANPFVWFAWIAILKGLWRPAVISSVIALVLGLDVFLLHEMTYGDSMMKTVPVLGLGVGGYLWLFSIVLALLGAAVGYFNMKQHVHV